MASSIKDVETISDFNELILFSGIGGREIEATDISKAKEAAMRLQEDDIYQFDFTDDTAFLKSVAKYMNSFRK